ncbi:hypothetical protein PVAND_005731 [Polypedilum vanderplanki]|uniref:RING-type domain-containing protein n=1 Tax=Polypedilum vanderplanki TaxID=319348 RepID=A0A9J6C1D9_POLVA|nr:hypothetical protein PVAND_005731 [Polypedilum vanderplanki]
MTFVCIICTENLNNSDTNYPVNIKACGHCFHSQCLKTWLQKSLTCPICRTPTVDIPSYVGKLHFQRVSTDLNSSSILSQLYENNDKYKKDLDEARQQMTKTVNEWKSKEEIYKKNEDEWKTKESNYKKSIAELLEKGIEFGKKEEEWKIKEMVYKETQQSYKQWWISIVADVTEMRKLSEKMMGYPSPSGKISEKLTLKNKVKNEQGPSHRPTASTPPVFSTSLPRSSTVHPFTRSISINKDSLRNGRVDNRPTTTSRTRARVTTSTVAAATSSSSSSTSSTRPVAKRSGVSKSIVID